MSHDWKPGDVALLTKNGVDHLALRTIYGWVVPAASGYRDTNQDFDAARRLVVLDPESPEDTANLSEALYLAGWRGASNMVGDYRAGTADQVQAALRDLRRPPALAEPSGIGAVVEDADGQMYVRFRPDGGPAKWALVTADVDREIAYLWSQIPAVRVLSEGVDLEAANA